ncbi:pyruvate, water dikinase regulatory protein [Bauldia sp.]|uniref:pyruvate, water dikinase regulatory protein n=1 Tax=Bauldia sp. TaxID=2575872 RepID=UPI003BAD9C47
MNSHAGFFHLHLISDATGETLIAVGRAAAAQYRHIRPVEHLHAMVRTSKQIDAIVPALEAEPGIVLYTLVDEELGKRLEAECRRIGIPCASVLEPVLQLLQNYLGAPDARRMGAQHMLDADYFRRIDALNFTMIHDDGQLAGSLEEADVVLVGVSRTSKTPTSIYLANRGVKTANIPIVPGVPLPLELETVKGPLIVGLTASTERIAQLRHNRVLSLNAASHGESYVDKAAITAEITSARKLFAKNRWPTIDVSRRSIEETATAILALRDKRNRDAMPP